ncbi:MAG TPA: hypothetical protein VEW48_00705 [Thermoanaerobaculia bacterium]|nr:hypothetical protein [Thermoanaerobaculia bacterium]
MPPAKSSHADLNLDAEMLMAAVEANASLLPNLDEQVIPLKATLDEVKALSVRQETLRADRQKLTQDLTVARARLRDLAIQLRAAIKGKLGPRTEKLVEFKMQPLRKRSRSVKHEPEPPIVPVPPVATQK